MSSVDKIYAGPGIFVWGVKADGTKDVDAITIDLTQGGIRFYTETTWFEPTADQTGTAPIKSISTGKVGKIEFSTPDMDFEKVVAFDANTTKVIDGTAADKVKYQVTGLAGQELPRKRAVIMPQGVSDPDRFIYIESCGIKFDLDAGFKLDDNLKMTVTGMGYPALDATPKGLIYTWGDITATA